MHDCRFGRVVPKTRGEFWKLKREATVKRDFRNEKELSLLGWRVLTGWECETRDKESLKAKLATFLND
jgi:DNA mismatch endonuclease (patch repair protein)